MSAKDQPDNTPLLLNELKIPGRSKDPLSLDPKVWGINRGAALDTFPRQGLLCQAGPWAPMNRGDVLVVYKDATAEIFRESVELNQVGTELQMFLPARHITEGSYALSYSVERLNSTPEGSETMQVRVKLTRPGGHDDNDEPGHSKLVMSIPREILAGGIDQDNVAAGVPITIGTLGAAPYPQAAAGDRIQVTWGGIFVMSAPLTQDQAEGKVPVVVKIEEGTIKAAGDSDTAGLAVAFEVYDLVDNRSEDWSVEQRVVVAVDQTLLVAPLLKETLNNQLDVDKLGDADGTAQIWVSKGSFEVGDTPILQIKGTPREGPPVDVEVPGATLVSVPATHETKIPNRVLRQLAQTQIALSYRLKKADGSPDKKAKTQFISVTGQLHRLLAPKALDAKQGAIDPLDPELKQVRIEIPFDDAFLPGQAIKLFWLGTRPDLTAYLPTLPLRPITQGDYEAKEPLLIIVETKHLTPIIGGKLELYYQLLIPDAVLATMSPLNQTHAIRESIHAEILQIGEPRLELPAPQVIGVVDGALPADTNGTRLIVDYLKTADGDEVIYTWEGSKTGAHRDSLKLNEFTAGQPVPFTIKAELIKGNEGGMVEARYEIKRKAGETNFSDSLEFRVGVKLELHAPGIKETRPDNPGELDPIAAKDRLTVVVPHYAGMEGTDKISVTWTGADGTPPEGSHTSTAVDVGTVGRKEIPIPNSVVAYNLGEAVEVCYTVFRNGTPIKSEVFPLNVQAMPVGELTAPLMLEAANNGAGPELDTSNLTNGATTRSPGWPLIADGQYVWLELQGFKGDGTIYNRTVMQAPGSYVNQTWVNQGYYDVRVPYAYLKDLGDNTELKMVFKAALGKSTNPDDAVVFPEKIYTVRALAKPIKPSIKEAPGSSTLNPIAAKDSLTVVVPHYAGMATTDQISVTWTGADGTPAAGSHTSTPQPVGTVGQKEVDIPNTVVAYNLGKPVTVFYTVYRNGSPITSEVFGLNVQNIPDEHAELPKPTIKDANEADGTLDLTSFTGDTQVLVNAWPLIAVGQKLWMRCEGTDENGATLIEDIHQGVSITTPGTQGGVLPRMFLQKLAHDSEIWVYVSVNLDGVANASTAVSLPVQKYTVRLTLPPLQKIYGQHRQDPEQVPIQDGDTWTGRYIQFILIGEPHSIFRHMIDGKQHGNLIEIGESGEYRTLSYHGYPVGRKFTSVFVSIEGVTSNSMTVTWNS